MRQVNAGLREKYGVDLDGTEALWRPCPDDPAEQERRIDVAARRVARFVRLSQVRPLLATDY
jgi:hypothetical protein